MLLLDSGLIILILLVSFSIRLGYWYFPDDNLIWVILGAPLISIPIFLRFGLYSAIIRYIGFKALLTVAQAVSLYAILWGITGFMTALEGIPRSVILINWALSLLVISGIRIIARLLLDDNIGSTSACRVLVYGAGDAGIQLISALTHSSEYHPVGFIDDSKELQGRYVNGLNVYSADVLDKVCLLYTSDAADE